MSEEPQRSLRKRKRVSYNESPQAESNTNETEDQSSKSRSSSTESVLYLCDHKKIPPVIVIEDSSEDELPQEYRTKLRSYRPGTASAQRRCKSRNKTRRRSRITPNATCISSSCLNDEKIILKMLSNMKVSKSKIERVYSCANLHSVS